MPQRRHLPQRQHLPNDARLRAIGMLEAGMRQVQVARRLGVSQSVISRLRTRLVQTNSTLDRRRSGRPRSTSQAQDQFLYTSVLRSRSVSAELFDHTILPIALYSCEIWGFKNTQLIENLHNEFFETNNELEEK